MRPPDVVIGSPSTPYMRRWWVIPRNPIFNVYLHQIVRSDDDRALHDHPWWNMSIILRGGYVEHTPKGQFQRNEGAVVFRGGKAAHRLEITGSPAWTLFITGPRFREWGFHCPHGWVPWAKFVSPDNQHQRGKGCDQ